jgi:hypothetical protein
MTLLVLVLIVLAATLGAGGYLVVQRRERALEQRYSAFVIAASGGFQAAMQVLNGIRTDMALIATRPIPASIERNIVRCEALRPVHNMQCIVGEAVVQARSEAHVPVAPRRADCFHVKALRMTVHAEGLPSVDQRVRITNVDINHVPQFDWCRGYNEHGPAGVVSDMFATPPCFAVAVEIGVSTTDNLIQYLRFTVRNDNPHAVRIIIEGYGEAVNPNVPRVEGSSEG